ncbi:alpha/beta hydrolase [Rhodobacter sp. Har01]|uniref:alpha/beta hydrolase n=1 Tax=Rhodobacter sp. Har01 TaxID=2883999 RepID=UPI001D08C87D|nr:alpha/beta hydrolase [Rhodobacter sp. Har01]MCB6178480.1 alpha/beta hydrolase [Rhodobacter sp. Har01]
MPDPDYSRLIDAPTWAFIRATEAAYPADTAALGIADQRAIYDRMCRAFFRGYPEGVTALDQSIAGIPCRRYPGAGPASVLYAHGGGFVVGGLHSHDDVCAEIRAATGLTVISVAYRLSPEHPHPAALDDVCGVIRATPGALVLVGDSAGGNLVAAAAHALRDPRLLGQVLIYPGLGGDRGRGSAVTHAFAPMLTAADLAFYAGIRHGGMAPPEGDATVSPLQDAEFSGLPMTLAIGAECDPLHDDAIEYAEKISAAGGLARAVTATGLVHGYLRARATVPRAAESFDMVCKTIAAFAEGRWPF